MKYLYSLLFTILTLLPSLSIAQCNNADVENGNFTGWTGTYGNDNCTGSIFGICVCYTPDPFQYAGLNQGAVNSAPNSLPESNHAIMTGGTDPIVGVLPVVYPTSGSRSIRLGNSFGDQNINGGGESISYTFTVNSTNSNFTYHYAVVLNDGGHSPGEQPYFKIRMWDGNNVPIDCATYDVDATTAQTIGGFVNFGGAIYKPWTDVFIPLNNYIGQTVRIEFSTRDCAPTGCDGSHWVYAYLDADCQPLQIISSTPTVCGGQTTTLTAPNGAATYQWTGPGIIPPSNTQIINIDQPGLYTVNMTTFGTVPCNFSIDTVMAGNPNNPLANFSTGFTCVGNPTQFTDLSTPVGLISNWDWDFDVDGNTDANIQSPTNTFPGIGTYPVHLTVTWAPCTADTIIDVVVSSAPTSTLTATTPVCVGASSTITYTGNASPGATYNWNFSGGTIVSGSGQGPYQIFWATPGNRNITLDIIDGLCVSTQTISSVTVNPVPVTTLGPDITICSGLSTNLTANGAVTYTWSPAVGLSATNGQTVTATPASTTTYTVTGSSLGCSSTDDIDVIIIPYPNVSVLPQNSTICQGQTVTLTASGATNYIWSPSTGLNTTSGQIVDATPNTSITYQVIGDDSGCADTAFSDITVNPIPTIIVSPDVDICVGDTTMITASGSTNYLWSPPNGLDNLINDTVNANPSVTTTYTVTGSSNNCTTSSNVTVNVHPIPVVIITTSIDSYCYGGTSQLISSGANTYLWSPASGLNTTTNDTVVTSTTSTQSYSVIGTTIWGCQDSAVSSITVNPLPIAGFSSATSGCVSFCVDFINTSYGSSNYLWNFGDGNYSNIQSPTYCYTSTGVYSVELITISDSLCYDTLNIQNYITVYPLPLADFTIYPPSASVIDPIFNFTDNSSSDVVQWYWDFGDGYNQNNLLTFEHVYPSDINSGTYSVNLYVVNQFGCVDTITHYVIITPYSSLYVPNSFTPNGNGLNDIFYAYGQGIISFDMRIYDRWGNYIFRSLDINIGWDGKVNGRMALNDVYVYKIIYSDLSGESKQLVGTVTLVK